MSNDQTTASGTSQIRMEQALERVVRQANAPSVSILPEIDEDYYRKARAILAASGMELDRISAAAIRGALKGIGEIARDGLVGGWERSSGSTEIPMMPHEGETELASSEVRLALAQAYHSATDDSDWECADAIIWTLREKGFRITKGSPE